MKRARAGFTLIEFLVLLTLFLGLVLGILKGYRELEQRRGIPESRYVLNQVVVSQTLHADADREGHYTTHPEALGLRPADGVRVELRSENAGLGFVAVVRHPQGGICGVGYGERVPGQYYSGRVHCALSSRFFQEERLTETEA